MNNAEKNQNAYLLILHCVPNCADKILIFSKSQSCLYYHKIMLQRQVSTKEVFWNLAVPRKGGSIKQIGFSLSVFYGCPYIYYFKYWDLALGNVKWVILELTYLG